jgi:hypothetical protein
VSLILNTDTNVYILLKLINLCYKRGGDFYWYWYWYAYRSVVLNLFNDLTCIHKRIKFLLISHRFNCYCLECSLLISPLIKQDLIFCLLSPKLRYSPHTIQSWLWTVYCGLHCWRRQLCRSTYLRLKLR